MNGNIVIELPFAVGSQVFLLKEIKRNEKSIFSFEPHTVKEFRIVVDEDGQAVNVKLKGMKPLYDVKDCFPSLNDLQQEINARIGGEVVIAEKPILDEVVEEVVDETPTDDYEVF